LVQREMENRRFAVSYGILRTTEPQSLRILFISLMARAQSLLFEQNFKGEVDEGFEWLVTLFRLRPDQRALIAIEEEGGKFVCFRGSRQIAPIYS
jgi:hypothetical protein